MELKIRGQKPFMELPIGVTSKYLDVKHSTELVDLERVRTVYEAKTRKVRAVIYVVHEDFDNGFTLAFTSEASSKRRCLRESVCRRSLRENGIEVIVLSPEISPSTLPTYSCNMAIELLILSYGGS
jgi:hypothetical protein